MWPKYGAILTIIPGVTPFRKKLARAIFFDRPPS